MACRLFVISGPSGAGKGTLVQMLMSARDDFFLSVSATTRQPRVGEVEGEAYFFLSNEQFDYQIENDGFLEWASVHGNRYGTLKSVVLDHIENGSNVILEIDSQGALQVKENFPDAILIFVKTPTLEILRQRLTDRKTESPEQIELRMKNAKLELEKEKCYNHSLVNDDLEKAFADLNELVNSYM